MKKSKIDLLTKGLFNEVSKTDVLTEVSPGKLVYKGKLLESIERADLIGQAKLLKKLQLFEMLMYEMKHLCNEKIYYSSKDLFDLSTAKMGLWFIDVLEKKIDKISTMLPERLPKRP